MIKKRIYLRGKVILIGTLVSIALTIITVFISGLPTQRSILENAWINISLISFILFCFLFVGLFYGLKIHDDLSGKFNFVGKSSILHGNSSFPTPHFEIPAGDGIGGIILSVVLWIVLSILFVIFLILLEVFLWFSIVLLIAMFYWVLMRALKLVLSKSDQCYGKYLNSILYAGAYTILYMSWMYAIFFISYLFNS